MQTAELPLTDKTGNETAVIVFTMIAEQADALIPVKV